MYKYIFLLLAVVCGFSNGLENLIGAPIESCISCICYARTGSYDLSLCGRRLMTFGKWRSAGSLTPSSSWRPAVDFRSCRANTNCVLNHIKANTERFGQMDCNLDGEYSCEDRFYIQNFNQLCVNRRVAPVWFNRFHSCLPYVNEVLLSNQVDPITTPENVDPITTPKIVDPITTPKSVDPQISQNVTVVVEQNLIPSGKGDNVNQNATVDVKQTGGTGSKQNVVLHVVQNAGTK